MRLLSLAPKASASAISPPRLIKSVPMGLIARLINLGVNDKPTCPPKLYAKAGSATRA